MEAGRNCGRGKDPEHEGMMLTYESDHCDMSQEEEEEEEEKGAVSRHEAGEEIPECESDLETNELSDISDEDISDTADTIKPEADDHIVTLSAAGGCHPGAIVMTSLLIIFIIQR